MADLPATAAWRHLDARVGFEVLFSKSEPGGYRFEGHSTAVEEGVAWSVSYAIEVDARWVTRSARVVAHSAIGAREVRLEADGNGAWLLDGDPAPQVEGCLDLDLEASAFTNAFPVRRLALKVGERAQTPAAYLRAPDLSLERLEQTYARLDDDWNRSRYDYASPGFDFTAVLVYDEHGLVLDYPGIAVRAA